MVERTIPAGWSIFSGRAWNQPATELFVLGAMCRNPKIHRGVYFSEVPRPQAVNEEFGTHQPHPPHHRLALSLHAWMFRLDLFDLRRLGAFCGDPSSWTEPRTWGTTSLLHPEGQVPKCLRRFRLPKTVLWPHRYRFNLNRASVHSRSLNLKGKPVYLLVDRAPVMQPCSLCVAQSELQRKGGSVGGWGE